MTLSDPLVVAPFTGPVDAVVRPPGSKSITNRALVTAALADGRSVLDGALRATVLLPLAVLLLGLGELQRALGDFLAAPDHAAGERGDTAEVVHPADPAHLVAIGETAVA